MISRNHDLTNNEIESINGNHAKLKAAHEKLKAEVEAQNKFNSDNQVSRLEEESKIESIVIFTGQCGQGAEEIERGEEHNQL